MDITMYELPSAWSQSDSNVSIFVDVPMHLLMLLVGKAVMLKVRTCLIREIKQNPSFVKWYVAY